MAVDVVGDYVYRGISKKRHLNYPEMSINNEAFLRLDRDIDGLSIGTSGKSVLMNVPGAYGMTELPVADIRQVVNCEEGLYLDVVIDNSPHGYIHNVPFHSKHPQAAEEVAGNLARMAKLFPQQDFDSLKAEFQSELYTQCNAQ